MTIPNPANMPGTTAQELRERAGAHDRAAADSFERSDTDGYVTQWAHGLNGQKDRIAARIAENNGYADFPALFDRSGALVPARECETRYGWAWRLLDADGEPVGWFNPSRAKDWRRRLRADAAKGFFVGVVALPAYADMRGGGRGMAGASSVTAVAVRKFNDFREYVIVDNGSPSVREDVIRAQFVKTISRHEERELGPDAIRARAINEQLFRATMWD